MRSKRDRQNQKIITEDNRWESSPWFQIEKKKTNSKKRSEEGEGSFFSDKHHGDKCHPNDVDCFQSVCCWCVRTVHRGQGFTQHPACCTRHGEQVRRLACFKIAKPWGKEGAARSVRLACPTTLDWAIVVRVNRQRGQVWPNDAFLVVVPAAVDARGSAISACGVASQTFIACVALAIISCCTCFDTFTMTTTTRA